MVIDRTTYNKARSPIGRGYDLRSPGTKPSGIVVHTTNGHVGTAFSAEAGYLCNAAAVSAHYLVGKAGEVVAFLAPGPYRAWHAGNARLFWGNDETIGIECHFTPGEEWTEAQRAALTALVQSLMADFAIPNTRIAAHRAVALPPGRKIDPSGWSDADFATWRSGLAPASPPLDAGLTLLSPPRATLAQVCATFTPNEGDPYTTKDLHEVIFPAYFAQATAVGLDPVLALCQSAHETGRWTSFWSQRPQRNPAGIGVTGQSWDAQPPNEPAAYNTDRQRWERGHSFASWADDAIPAHLGRLLAWALPQGSGTSEQQALIDRALSVRPLPANARGSALTAQALGRVHNPSGIGWADPGDSYGARLAALVASVQA